MDRHPLTGDLMASPASPGSGWPGEPATPATPSATGPDLVPKLAAEAADLAELSARISVCRACPRLVEWRESVAIEHRRAAFAQEPYWGRPVPAFGDPQARHLIIGLAPAAHGANRTGRMFTGDRSGEWLYAALHRAGFANRREAVAAGDGLELTDLRITAPVHCAPPANKPTTSEKTTCGAWLDRELQLSAERLTSILILGAIGWQAFFAAAARVGWQVPRPRPKFGHAVVSTVEAGGRRVRVIGCYHVSQQNTFTGTLTVEMLDEAMALLRSPH